MDGDHITICILPHPKAKDNRKDVVFVSYEMFRNSLLTKLVERLPAKLLNDVMHEIDLLSQDYTFEKACTDIITLDTIPEMVKNYIASMAVENCKKTTLRDYKMNLVMFFDRIRKPYTSVTTNDIRCYLFGMQQEKGWTPETMEHKRVIINSFFNWLVANEYLNRNPAGKIKPTRLPKRKLKPLTQIELEQFRNACQTERERALVDFLFSTGCRISEAVAVTMDDINWADKSIIIRHGKGDKERTVYFNAEAELSMKRYINNVERGTDNHLFIKSKAPFTGVTKEAMEKLIREIRGRIPELLSVKVTPHTFRRTMGTLAVSRGCPIEQIKELLGHESLDTTMQYVTISQEETRHSHNKYLAG